MSDNDNERYFMFQKRFGRLCICGCSAQNPIFVYSIKCHVHTTGSIHDSRCDIELIARSPGNASSNCDSLIETIARRFEFEKCRVMNMADATRIITNKAELHNRGIRTIL